MGIPYSRVTSDAFSAIVKTWELQLCFAGKAARHTPTFGVSREDGADGPVDVGVGPFLNGLGGGSGGSSAGGEFDPGIGCISI